MSAHQTLRVPLMSEDTCKITECPTSFGFNHPRLPIELKVSPWTLTAIPDDVTVSISRWEMCSSLPTPNVARRSNPEFKELAACIGNTWLIRERYDAGKDWRPKGKRTTQDEMARWCHRALKYKSWRSTWYTVMVSFS